MTNSAGKSSEGRETPASAGTSPAAKPDRLAPYRKDLRAAEREAAKVVDYRYQLPLMTTGMMAVLLYFFLPHAGAVMGYDVLFHSAKAGAAHTTYPEYAYATLALIGGLLLTVGTIVSKSWLVAWVNWAVGGIGWWYSILAIWMRQSRPVTDTGVGPSFGLIVGCVGMTLVFGGLTWLLFTKNPLQRALAAARREEASNDAEAQARQQVLRTGIAPRPAEEIVDDRRARARARRQRKQEG
ncbi:Rv2732c family membrane protein [Corynebacterium heidelbergense]|uniref:Rv2732c family membrane protein n=1 Tax=Corynebacterium heidelbergense TaxID=2055947 RepID=UPI001EE6F33D|nr:hypothetical protein [Corynebacterium heidelbergense]